MITRKQKEKIIEEVAKKLKKIKSAVFVDYKGLRVPQIEGLRRKLKEEGAELKVAKKTLIDLALKKADFEDISIKQLSGQIALALSEKDEISSAKILADFAKKNEGPKILGAILEGKFLNQEQALALSKVPSREQSLAALVGALNAPIANFVGVLRRNLRNLVYILGQIKKS